ncbi:hypothetical protein SDC9_165349 [bioreactor metagenome]|uniref:Uncharacterized protein n=1 Tax=bioreactor metagenome TaxID=1076179 RepID=A0A645FU34_9ZZZZ
MANRHVAVRELIDLVHTSGEEIHNAVFKAHLPFGDEHPDGKPRDGFAFGVRDVPIALIIGAKGRLGDHLSVFDDEHTVHVQCGVVSKGVEKVRNFLRRYALGLRRRAGEKLLHRGGDELRLLRRPL